MMIKNLIFDYGGVLLDWNPHYLYDPYFGDVDKAEWFLTNICTYEWNAQHGRARFESGLKLRLVARLHEK